MEFLSYLKFDLSNQLINPIQYKDQNLYKAGNQPQVYSNLT
jgi:hypothetical protein